MNRRSAIGRMIALCTAPAIINFEMLMPVKPIIRSGVRFYVPSEPLLFVETVPDDRFVLAKIAKQYEYELNAYNRAMLEELKGRIYLSGRTFNV